MNSKTKRKIKSRRIETRRLYKFEQVFFKPDSAWYLTRRHTPRYLRELADKVWEKHGRENLPTPEIIINPDAKQSWCEGFKLIQLATGGKKHQDDTIEVLLHELAHAIGYYSHGRSFVKKYFELLVEYGRMHEGELLMGLHMFNIKV